MKRKYLDLYLGLFVLSGLAVAAYMVIKFGGMSSVNKYNVIVQFDFVKALIREAPVYHAGVECGKVKEIIPWGMEVKDRADVAVEKVKVVLSIDREITLRTKDEIKIVPLSLLGEKVIEIAPGPLDAPPLPQDGSAVMVGTNPEEPLDTLRQVLGPLAEEETQHYVKNIFRSFSELTDHLNQMTGEEVQVTLRDTLQNLGLTVSGFPSVLTDLRAAVRTIATAGQQAQRLLTENREQISGLIASMDETLKSFGRVADTLSPIMANIGAGRGGLGKLINDPSWYANLKAILIAVREKGLLDVEKAFQEEQAMARRRPPEPTVWVR